MALNAEILDQAVESEWVMGHYSWAFTTSEVRVTDRLHNPVCP